MQSICLAQIPYFEGGPSNVASDNVDMVIDFNAGSPGDLISVSNLTASTRTAPSFIGGTWTLPTRSPLQHTFTITSSPLTLLSPITVNGITYTSTAGRAIKFDLDLAVSNNSNPVYEQELFTFAANSVTNVSLGSMSTFAATLDTEADMFNLYSPFSVTQFHNNNGSAFLNAHAQYSGGSVFGSEALISGGPYWITQRANNTSNITEVVVQNGTTGAFVGCSRTQLDPWALVSLFMGDYLLPKGGNFKHSIMALAFGSKATLPLAGGSFVLPGPATVTASDELNDVSVGFGGLAANALAFAYKIERSSDGGSTWSTIDADLETRFDGAAISPYLDSTAVLNTTYLYRVTSLLNQYSSTPTVSNSVTHTGSGITFISADTAGAGSSATAGLTGYKLVVGASNITVTSLGMFAYSSDVSTTRTVAIYNSSCSSIISSSVNVSAHDNAYHYNAITPTTLTSGGTYYMLFDDSDGITSYVFNDAATFTSDATIPQDTAQAPPCTNSIEGSAGHINKGPNFKY